MKKKYKKPVRPADFSTSYEKEKKNLSLGR
jgi:hypothetical protein